MTVRTRRILWIGLAALVAVLALREMGLVDGYWHSFAVVDVMNYQASGLGSDGESGIPTLKQYSGTSSNNWKGNDRGAYLGTSPFQMSDGLWRALERRCQGNRVGGIYATDNISGLFWTPLIKDGDCRYSVTATVRADDGTRWDVTVSGHAAFHAHGPCSIRRARAMLYDVIADHIAKQLDGSFR